jgi:hypothetical protein
VLAWRFGVRVPRSFRSVAKRHKPRRVRQANLRHHVVIGGANFPRPAQIVADGITHEIVRYTNKYLRVPEIEDWPNALNGLQVENSGRVTKIGAAVDVSTRVLNEAAKKDVDLLIVHHGIFWPGLQPVTKALRRQLKIAFENDIAIYSAHLPLDIHPEVGNNAQLAAALGIKSKTPFFEEKGQLIGLKPALPFCAINFYATSRGRRAERSKRLRLVPREQNDWDPYRGAGPRKFIVLPGKDPNTPLSPVKGHTGPPSPPKSSG